jgi:D-3-phosphoglycerate dehydrogenase
MKRVLLCQDIHPDGRRVLQRATEIVVASDPQEEKIRPIIGDFHGVIVRTATQLGRQTIDAAGNLEVIGRTGAGVDNIDVEAATRRGIPVCHTPEANFSSVVEHTLALILALAKQLPLMDEAVREGRFPVRYEYRPVDVADKILGIVGLGRIGRELARRAPIALNMKVIAYDPYIEPRTAEKTLELVRDVGSVFERADFVTVHVPHVDETHHLVNARMIAKMRPTSFLINTSRGAVVDESALVRALSEGRIAGAGLDVFEKEPPEADNPLLSLPNVILTPHSSALTKQCVARMAVGAAQGVLDVLQGRKPQYVFNPEVL